MFETDSLNWNVTLNQRDAPQTLASSYQWVMHWQRRLAWCMSTGQGQSCILGLLDVKHLKSSAGTFL